MFHSSHLFFVYSFSTKNCREHLNIFQLFLRDLHNVFINNDKISQLPRFQTTLYILFKTSFCCPGCKRPKSFFPSHFFFWIPTSRRIPITVHPCNSCIYSVER